MLLINKLKNQKNKNYTSNQYWVEVDQITEMTCPQKFKNSETEKKDKPPFFTVGFNDYDNNEYIINFDPYNFLNWIDNDTLKRLTKYLKEELNEKTK